MWSCISSSGTVMIETKWLQVQLHILTKFSPLYLQIRQKWSELCFVLNFCSKGETVFQVNFSFKTILLLTLISTLMVGKASGAEDDIQVFVEISVT